MDEITRSNRNGETTSPYERTNAVLSGGNLIEITDSILFDARADITQKDTLSVPIAQLATLGAGVSALIPALRTVTQTTSINAQGLFRVANAGIGDALKATSSGDFWGAIKAADGTSKLARLQSAGPMAVTNTSVMPIAPATMMMAVALFSIEQQLGKIMEMEKRILSFLEIEKESEVEADVETLSNIILKYKHNWDNEHFIASNHKLVLDIQRTARKNMNSYQKRVGEVLHSKKFIVAQSKVDSTAQDLQKKFKYYRLSLYTFSMASLIEIMLSGNFKEEYIRGVQNEIKELSMKYRELYGQCSLFLEKASDESLKTNALKGFGIASKAVGKFIGSIPMIKDGSVDEFLENKGMHLKESALNIEKSVVESFAQISNPETYVFIEKMEDLIKIYNHTTGIYFDDKQIYLVAG